MSDSTRLGLLGDPCQVRSSITSLPTAQSLHASCKMGMSILLWFLLRFLHEGPRGKEIVFRLDLQNRYQRSRRCRLKATSTINRLTPYCLPCPPTATPAVWTEKVFSEKVWANLKPVIPKRGFQEQLTQYTPELVVVWPDVRFQMPKNMSSAGYIGRSRFDTDQALYAALTAVSVAWTQIMLRQKWQDYTVRHGWHWYYPSGTEERVRKWRTLPFRVVIICAYTAMVNLTRDAVNFVLGISHPFDNPRQCTIDCVTLDSVQGETFDYVVLALPPIAAEWSE